MKVQKVQKIQDRGPFRRTLEELKRDFQKNTSHLPFVEEFLSELPSEYTEVRNDSRRQQHITNNGVNSIVKRQYGLLPTLLLVC